MLRIIEDNPYRVLGVFATSRTAEIVANRGRITAFLRVGRTCEFPLDLPFLLPPVVRTEENVADANARLTLPQDQLKYAQFWFVKGTSLDDIAFNHLLSGNTEQAVEIWAKRDNASSLQNRIVCALSKGSYGAAIQCAEKLYTGFSKELVAMVLGENATISSENLHETFLEVVMECQKPAQILGWISLPQWKEYVAKKSTKLLIDSILAAVETAKASKGQGPKARFDAGTKLMNDTKAQLAQLKSLLQTGDLQYQMVADKLGLAILQCGIDYYNDSDDDDAAYKAMELQEYALSIVVGQMAKERCQENVDILQGIIDELPPMEVIEEDKAIKAQLFVFQLQSKNIEMSIGLIKRCAPSLVAIKTKLGKTNEYYLRISTQVANSALRNLIEEVNKAQESDDIPALIKVLTEAWRATLYLDKLDKTNEYASGRYHECRNALHDIIDRLKGFEYPFYSAMYRYGCGWANKLDVSDVDLRTEEEVYAECETLKELETYLERFPKGRHRRQAQNRIAEIERKEAEKRERDARKRREIAACQSLQEVILLYSKEKESRVYIDQFSNRAFELANCEEDFQKVVSTFSVRSAGGQKAKSKIEQFERIRKEKAEKRKNLQKKLYWVGIAIMLVLIVLGIAALNGAFLTTSATILKITSILVGIVGFIFSLYLCAKIENEGVPNGCIQPFAWIISMFIIGITAVPIWMAAEAVENCDNSNESESVVMNIDMNDYCKDFQKHLEENEEHAWDTEPKAWQKALFENSVSAYTKYKSLYPDGEHADICEKKLIDLEVSDIYAGDHGELPGMDKVGYGSGSTSGVEIENNTSYTMTILYSGPDSKRLVISPHSTGTLRLPNGTYRVAASVSSSSVRSYAGTESLTGGSYSASYYISTSHVKF